MTLLHKIDFELQYYWINDRQSYLKEPIFEDICVSASKYPVSNKRVPSLVIRSDATCLPFTVK